MRLTVGPLPPAVYWRRRAVVLGSLLIVIFVVYSACSASGRSDEGGRDTAGNPTPTADVSPDGSATPGEELLTPEVGGSSQTDSPEADSSSEAPQPQPATQPPAAPADPTGGCTDAEVSVRPVPAKTTITRNTPVDLRLTITNVSERTCSRDVGADLQELRIVQGAQTVWSSDHCGAQRGSDVRPLVPGDDRNYMVTWNGKSSSKCASGAPAGPVPAPGQYQLLGRLGTKLGGPITLTLR